MENPFYIEVIQKQQEKKNLELANMKLKFKRMNLREKRGFIKQKEFEITKMKFDKKFHTMSKELNSVRKELSQGHHQQSLPETDFNSQKQSIASNATSLKVSSLKVRDPGRFSNLENIKEIKRAVGMDIEENR